MASEGGLYINTWGDGVIVAFDEINSGLKCACKIVRHLDIDGIETRVGVHWGPARIRVNSLTERLDVDGDSINLGSRIEFLAEPGQVLATEEVRFHGDVDATQFEFTERLKSLEKGAAGKPAGTTIPVFEVRYLPNA